MDSPSLKAPAGATRKRKTVGRGSGSGHGGTSTRGSKGQNARAGGGVRPGFEGGQMPLFRRVARRGFSNHKFRKDYHVVNLSQLEGRFAKGDLVNRASLVDKGLVKGVGPVKILADGEAPEGLRFEIDAVSAAAREKISRAGGQIAGPPTARRPGRERKSKE